MLGWCAVNLYGFKKMREKTDVRDFLAVLPKESTHRGLFRYVEEELSDQIQPHWPQGTMCFRVSRVLHFIITLGGEDPGKHWSTSQ